MKTITLELRPEDAEPILREAAYKTALYGGRWLHVTRRCVNRPGVSSGDFESASKEWHREYLAAERLVEAFGVEPETTSEGETLTVYVPDIVLKSHIVDLGRGMKFRHIDSSKPDPNRKNWRPEYRRGVHEEAARQAADRVVRRWRVTVYPAGRLLADFDK